MIIFQKGFNFSQDGPGNRLVYHLSGCNMRCPWCSNPEGMEKGDGKDFAPDEIVKECIRCKPMFFSGGGVTFTGGEATIWHDELLETLKMLKQENIHTAIETNGTDKRLFELLPFIDYFIMDFKHYDEEEHKKFTGLSNQTVKENFERNCKEKRQQHIRIPLINNVNTQNPEGFAQYFSKFDTENCVFEFLAYHEYGKEKWKTEYKIKDGFVSPERIKEFKDTFTKYNLKLITT